MAKKCSLCRWAETMKDISLLKPENYFWMQSEPVMDPSTYPEPYFDNNRIIYTMMQSWASAMFCPASPYALPRTASCGIWILLEHFVRNFPKSPLKPLVHADKSGQVVDLSTYHKPYLLAVITLSPMGTMRYFQAWQKCPCKKALSEILKVNSRWFFLPIRKMPLGDAFGTLL